MNKMSIAAIAALLLSGISATAQVTAARIETRVSFNSENYFNADRFSIALGGNISDEFSYYIFHHLNRGISQNNLLQSTDQAYIKYRASEKFEILAGKSMVEYGGYEYYAAPIDVYYAGEYWNNFYPFQLGVTARYRINEGKDVFAVQICRSPYSSDKEVAYNLTWEGHHGILDTWQSVNLFENPYGESIAHAALGFCLDFKPLKVELDAINRSLSSELTVGKDYSLACNAVYSVSPSVNIVAKADYDKNDTIDCDSQCLPGTDFLKAGAGVEFFPIKGSKDVRLHCVAYRSSGSVAYADCSQTHFTFGVKWNFNLLKQ